MGSQLWAGAIVLAVLAASSAKADERFVDTTRLNCRQSPTLASPVVAQFVRDEPVTVLYAERGWAQVQNAPLCWVRPWLLTRHRPFVTDRSARPSPPAYEDTLRRPVWLSLRR